MPQFYDTIKATSTGSSNYLKGHDMAEDVDGFADYKKAAWDAAMQYLGMGWSIIPLRFSDKCPPISWREYQDRQPTEEEVTSWFEDGVPDGKGGLTTAFGIAVVTGAISGIVVCDCDNLDATSYAINVAGLFSLLTVTTTRGQHIYFKHPGGKIQNKVGGVGRDWPDVHGLDLRGDGGYVVAPPSLKFKNDVFQHSYAFNCPAEEVENFASTLPVWPGIRAKQETVPLAEWSFDSINLASVKSHGDDVWKQTQERMDTLGRKLRDGDGRNTWLVRYIGWCVATDMDEAGARQSSAEYQAMFFDPILPTQESETVLASVVGTDRRNHPEKWAKREAYESKNETRKGRADALRLITPGTLGRLKAMAGNSQFLVTPYIPPASIIQVVGFNGHGKSLWLLNLVWAAARGESFSSGHITKKLRTLYLDFEGSSGTLNERVEACGAMSGAMDDNLIIWNADVADDPMNLNDAEANVRLLELINEVKPQLVVVDTVRQAWQGMEENSPQSWVKVNQLALACRNNGMSIILVHHRNKPNLQGHGREAGSTAQLKDLDVQIIVTKVVVDLDQAKREAAMPDSTTSVADSAGATMTAWSYLTRMLEPNEVIKMVFEVSFGKMRKATDNHITTYTGMVESTVTGAWRVVNSMTPLQKSVTLSRRGMSTVDISATIGVSQPTVTNWLKEAISGNK
jgi:hypothetical protein